jgi:hypothetical protein
MKHNVILEIDGVRHKLIKGKEVANPCSKCSLEQICCKGIFSRMIMCLKDVPSSRYRKCKKGE